MWLWACVGSVYHGRRERERPEGLLKAFTASGEGGKRKGQYRVPFKVCSSDLILPSPTVHHLPVGPQARDQAFTTEL